MKRVQIQCFGGYIPQIFPCTLKQVSFHTRSNLMRDERYKGATRFRHRVVTLTDVFHGFSHYKLWDDIL
jgi:hypothetical protein